MGNIGKLSTLNFWVHILKKMILNILYVFGCYSEAKCSLFSYGTLENFLGKPYSKFLIQRITPRTTNISVSNSSKRKFEGFIIGILFIF